MHRYEELEKRYYRNLYLKIFFILIIVILFIVSGYYFYNKFHISNKNNSKQISYNKSKNISNKKEKNLTKKIVKNKIAIKKAEKNKTKIVKEPIKFILPDITQINVDKNKTKKIKKDKKVKITFTIQEISISKQDISVLIQNFNKNPTFEVAITIAKYFFNKNKLKKAQIWALKANNINPQRPESWIIFANILNKENKKEKAIEVLKIYKESYGINEKIENKIRSLNAK